MFAGRLTTLSEYPSGYCCPIDNKFGLSAPDIVGAIYEGVVSTVDDVAPCPKENKQTRTANLHERQQS